MPRSVMDHSLGAGVPKRVLAEIPDAAQMAKNTVKQWIASQTRTRHFQPAWLQRGSLPSSVLLCASSSASQKSSYVILLEPCPTGSLWNTFYPCLEALKARERRRHDRQDQTGAADGASLLAGRGARARLRAHRARVVRWLGRHAEPSRRDGGSARHDGCSRAAYRAANADVAPTQGARPAGLDRSRRYRCERRRRQPGAARRGDHAEAVPQATRAWARPNTTAFRRRAGRSAGTTRWRSLYPGACSNCAQTQIDSARMLRGGSWYDAQSSALEASARTGGDPATRLSFVGFRCASTEYH
jgi:hypothetical protein